MALLWLCLISSGRRRKEALHAASLYVCVEEGHGSSLLMAHPPARKWLLRSLSTSHAREEALFYVHLLSDSSPATTVGKGEGGGREVWACLPVLTIQEEGGGVTWERP